MGVHHRGEVWAGIRSVTLLTVWALDQSGDAPYVFVARCETRRLAVISHVMMDGTRITMIASCSNVKTCVTVLAIQIKRRSLPSSGLVA